MTLKVVFFDLEEGGLSGSLAYFAGNPARALPDYAMNLDIFGYGDTIFATALKQDARLDTALQAAAAEHKFALRLLPPAQYPASDHRTMMAAGVETLGITLIDGKEIDGIVNLVTGVSKEVPAVLGIIHTTRDTLETIRPPDMARAVPVLERLIRLVDFQ
jgi:Zn-dependent M28 family amino/carboxypeptidase